MSLPHPEGPDVVATWLLYRALNGHTLAELGSAVGSPASLDSLAVEVMIRMVSLWGWYGPWTSGPASSL